MWKGIPEYSCCKEERGGQPGKKPRRVTHGTHLRAVMMLKWAEWCIPGRGHIFKKWNRGIDGPDEGLVPMAEVLYTAVIKVFEGSASLYHRAL